MRRVAIGALLVPLTAFSAAALPAEIDTDGDGQANLAEFQVLFPGLTAEVFAEMDTDEDGYVNDAEMLAAVDAEIIPDPMGDE